MKACIRRGAEQIGGSAVEIIASNGQRLIVDLGLPLDAESNTADLLPNIKGLINKSDDLLGLLISHPHQDHYALGQHIDSRIPVYMGRIGANILNIAKQHNTPNAVSFDKVEVFESNKTFEIGTFKITPYLVDHSAYDAYAFLIEADGKKIFYSGDFRSHGRKSKIFEKMIANPPKDIDVLFVEGSCLGRDKSEKYETEEDLEARFLSVFKKTEGLVFIQASSQNIDRIVTVYRATKKSGRKLVMSGYTGHILWGLENPKIPNFTWSDVKKFATDETAPHNVTAEMMSLNPNKYVVLLGGSIFNQLKSTDLINSSTSFIYSMWDGYKELYAERIEKMKESGAYMEDIHTSGHADIPTLKKFVEAINPNVVVPIHTFFPKDFIAMFSNTKIHKDNEVFEI